MHYDEDALKCFIVNNLLDNSFSAMVQSTGIVVVSLPCYMSRRRVWLPWGIGTEDVEVVAEE